MGYIYIYIFPCAGASSAQILDADVAKKANDALVCFHFTAGRRCRHQPAKYLYCCCCCWSSLCDSSFLSFYELTSREARSACLTGKRASEPSRASKLAVCGKQATRRQPYFGRKTTDSSLDRYYNYYYVMCAYFSCHSWELQTNERTASLWANETQQRRSMRAGGGRQARWLLCHHCTCVLSFQWNCARLCPIGLDQLS